MCVFVRVFGGFWCILTATFMKRIPVESVASLMHDFSSGYDSSSGNNSSSEDAKKV